MNTSRLVGHFMAGRLRGISRIGVLINAASLPSFLAEADLALSATATPASVVVDRELQFSVLLVNQGPDSADDVAVEIDLPTEVSLIKMSPTQRICLPGPPLICQLGQVNATAPGNRVGVTVDVAARSCCGHLACRNRFIADGRPVPGQQFCRRIVERR